MKIYDEQDSRRIYQIVGRNIKYYRHLYSLTKKKMTQEKLSEMAEISISLLACIESENVDQSFNMAVLWKIAHALDVPIHKFFETPEVEKEYKKKESELSFN